MSENIKEIILNVPAELTRQCRGVSVDMGSSTLKIIYRSKEDSEQVSSEGTKTGHLHLLFCSKHDLAEALDYITGRADVTRTGDELPIVYTTGVGCTAHGKTIAEKLNVKLEQVTEFDCFAKSFFYLASRLPRTELLETFLEEATVEPLEYMRNQMAFMNAVTTENETGSVKVDLTGFMQGIQLAVGRPSAAALETGNVPLAEAEPDMFPCMLAMCGSGIGFMKIEKDGSFKVVDGSNRGGRAFLGIGSLFTGCKTFTELVELASTGNPQNVDTYSDSLLDARETLEGDVSVYNKAGKCDPGIVFCFGKTVGSKIDDFNREDLARSWLNYVIYDLVQAVLCNCNKHGVKRLFFCGGFCSDPFVRHVITTETVRRNLFQLALQSPDAVVQFDFVRPGAHLGALGCAVNDFERFAGKKN